VLRITAHDVRLHSDAGARIRWRTLLGGSMYIDLTPGSSSAPALDGEIPLSRTGSQVDWDQFNSQLPAAAWPQLRRMLAALDSGLSAPRPEGETLAVLGPAARTVGQSAQGRLTPVVERLNANLIPFLDRTDPDTRLKTYETFGPVASALGATLSGFDVNGYSYNLNVAFSTGSVLLPCDLGMTGAPYLQSCLTQAPAALLRSSR
jgi:ABC-type transporter Mla subunit MlaD